MLNGYQEHILEKESESVAKKRNFLVARISQECLEYFRIHNSFSKMALFKWWKPGDLKDGSVQLYYCLLRSSDLISRRSKKGPLIYLKGENGIRSTLGVISKDVGLCDAGRLSKYNVIASDTSPEARMFTD